MVSPVIEEGRMHIYQVLAKFMEVGIALTPQATLAFGAYDFALIAVPAT